MARTCWPVAPRMAIVFLVPDMLVKDRLSVGKVSVALYLSLHAGQCSLITSHCGPNVQLLTKQNYVIDPILA